MSTRVFALIIGIDNYKSGSIWNLESCVDDAKKIKRWLTYDLSVPRDQICLLLDSEATKLRIEDSFMSHLVNNPAIERGDAIFIYFAGHGSSMTAPPDWFNGDSGNVELICPHDHDTKGPEGRIAGISDRSVHALIKELHKAKGDNITLMLDCCFSPTQSPANIRERSHTRWTPTLRAKRDDLYAGLWQGARGEKCSKGLGFYQPQSTTHVLVAACRPGEKAVENKDGGKFTNALLEAKQEIALHRTTYNHLIDYLLPMMPEDQRPLCLGRHRNRVIFDAVPFLPDARYVSVGLDNDKRLRIEMGAIHGIVEGSELSVHIHNFRGSLNPPIANVHVIKVHATWSLGQCTSQETLVPKGCWARITRWNNRTPFRVHLKKGIASLIRRWKVRKGIPSKVGGPPSKGGLNILRVKHAAQADISIDVGCREITVERHDEVIAANCRRSVQLEKKKDTELTLVDAAARFHLHLHRRNPETPLRNLVSMELFRLDPLSWSKVGANLLENGRTTILYEQGAIFSVVIHNKSDVDLWPYLAYMDPNCYGITMLYHPDPSSSPNPPLRKHGRLEIGSGKPGSEALSFNLADDEFHNSGFLKLFISSTSVPMAVIGQGPSPMNSITPEPFVGHDAGEWKLDTVNSKRPQLWDTTFACVTFIKHF